VSIGEKGRRIEKIKNGKSKFKSGRENSKSRGAECWRCDKRGHIQRDCKQKKDGEGKSKEKNVMYVRESDGSDGLILSLAGPGESWVINSDASFSRYFLTRHLSELCER